MAQIEFTALVNDIRGRCGDIIYSFSRGVHYIKRHQPAPAYPLPDDAPEAGCPCGWFDEDYRMLDVVPGLPD